MSSIIKVDQIRSDSGTVNLSSNLAFSSALSMSGPVTLNSPTIATPTIATPTMTGQAVIPSINLTGGQIVFPATQNASANANTLDDYEEGTFTPRIYGSTTAGTQAQIIRTGSYTKVGRFVFMYISLSNFTLTGAAGNIVLGDLPFSFSACAGLSVYLEGIDPSYNGTVDNHTTLGLRFAGGSEMFFGPTVANGWDSYMTASTTWTGGGGGTYGTIALWGIT